MSEAQIRPAEHQKLPASWLAPALHSVYLHAMINFAEAEFMALSTAIATATSGPVCTITYRPTTCSRNCISQPNP